MVRSEFCKKVDDAGGLDLIKSVMETFTNSDVSSNIMFDILVITLLLHFRE